MTSHSDDILDRVGFRRSDILPLLAEAGIVVGDAKFVRLGRTDWSDWKLRLAVADYLTDTEVAGALADIDLSAPGWLPDEVQAELSAWESIVRRASGSGSLKAVAADLNGDGTPRAWEIRLSDLAAWCASRNPPIPYPLPGNPLTAMPTTDTELLEALAAAERERDHWKSEAQQLGAIRQQIDSLRAEIERLRAEIRAKDDKAGKVTAELERLKADALTGKARTTALKIIAGMAMSGYGMDIHSARLEGIGEVVGDLQRSGAGVVEKTLRDWIKEAATIVDPPGKDA